MGKYCNKLILYSFQVKTKYQILGELPYQNLIYCNNANSPASGGCHPHFKVFTRLSKQLPFHSHFCPIRHINEWSIVNAFFTSQVEIWETAFQNSSHTYSIDKDMPLTFWLMWLSLFLFLWLFFPLKFQWRYRKVLSVIWQIFYEFL